VSMLKLRVVGFRAGFFVLALSSFAGVGRV
jgi:hypothetical protein